MTPQTMRELKLEIERAFDALQDAIDTAEEYCDYCNADEYDEAESIREALEDAQNAVREAIGTDHLEPEE